MNSIVVVTDVEKIVCLFCVDRVVGITVVERGERGGELGGTEESLLGILACNCQGSLEESRHRR